MVHPHAWRLLLAFAGSLVGLFVGFGLAARVDGAPNLGTVAVMLVPGASTAAHGLAGQYFGGWIDRLRATRED